MRRPGRLLASAVGSVTMAMGLGASGSTALGAVSHAVTYHPVIKLAAPAVSGKTVQSTNWSGMDEGLLDTHTTFSSITGQWTVPAASQHTKGQAESAATWLGIGGGCVDMTSGCAVTDPTLVQAGTEEDVSASGTPTYSAWWEILPAPSISTSTVVHPGDRVSLSITGPVVWKIAFKDLTDGQSFTQTVPYPSTMDSAEWIEEAPVVINPTSPLSTGEAALPNLGAANFDLGTLNGANPHLTSANEIQMASSSGAVQATPSPPDDDTDGFNVCTWATSCTPPASSGPVVRHHFAAANKRHHSG